MEKGTTVGREEVKRKGGREEVRGQKWERMGWVRKWNEEKTGRSEGEVDRRQERDGKQKGKGNG